MRPPPAMLPPRATLTFAPGSPLFYAGLALGAVVLLGGYAWLIAAFVTAAGRQRKSQGWLGIGLGVGLLAAWSVLIVGGLAGVGLYARRNAQERTRKAYSALPSTLRGMHKPFTITMPGGWSNYPNPPENADVRISRDGLYFEVFSRGAMGTSIEAAERWQTRLRELSDRCELGNLSSLQIDGATFLTYPARTRRKGSPEDYERLYYVYAGLQGTYEMVGWRIKAWRPGDQAALNDIATSFRFPPTTAKAPNARRVAAQPTIIPWPTPGPSASPGG